MTQPPVVHSALPETLTSAASDVFDTAAVAHVAHGDGDAVAAAEAVVDDRRAARQGLRVLVVIGQDSRSERARRGLASPGQSTPGGHRR